jgi:DNA primase
MCTFSDLCFRRLREQVSIGQVLATYGLDSGLRQRGDKLVGPCPLHGGDNPGAFNAHLGRGLWNCYTHCGGGDVVELVRRIEHCSYAEVAHHLRRLAHDGVLPPSPAAASMPASPALPAHRQPTFRPVRRRIPLNPRTPFLQEGKGITPATASRFEAGLPDPQSSFLRGTVAVRLHDLDGNPLGYCGRRLDPDAIARWGKWRFPAGLPKAHILYNAHRARTARAGGIVVVECPWAVMRLVQAGVPGAVALLGTSLNATQAAWLGQAPALLLLLDGDDAGRKATRAIAAALGTLTRVHVHQLRADQEPEDLSDQDLASLARPLSPSSSNQ